MTLKECYEIMGGDFEGVYGRMMKKEALVLKFVKKFLDDGSYNSLKENLEAGNLEEAFRAAHTLKGVAQNLGFTSLYGPSSDLAEILRHGGTDGTEELMVAVTAAYEATIEAIKAL